MVRWFAAFVLTVFMCAGAALAKAPAPKVQAALNSTALHPGQQAAVAVTIDVPEGLHAQSHTPSSEDFIALTLTPKLAGPVKALEAVYPKGQEVEYPSLGKLNVYTGRVMVYLPITVDANAAAGPLQIGGSVRLQMCNDQSCFPPNTIPFTVDTQIVPVDQAVSPANGELFAGFDPRVFAANSSALPPPAATESASNGTSIQFFGVHFTLANNAYALAFGLAFVVGIIFNLMPCVLPVLPLKAIGFYEASQHNRLRCFLLGLTFSAGLMAVFAILGVLVIIVHLPWGSLFANGWFVWGIVAILVIMAIGQLGAFSVLLPSAVYNYVPNHSSWIGNFLFGGFTAILSTPCTAPMFVGLLLWASTQPNAIGLTAIQMVGLGMAAPYLVLAAVPELARKVPRTGAWSELLKQFMAFLLLAVAAYFAAGRLVAGNGYLWIVFAVVAAGCIFLVARTMSLSSTLRSLATASVIAAILLGSMLYFTLKLTSGKHDLIAWQPYSQEALESAAKDGRVVMLEFTANWCANCKELESRVFTNPRTAKAIHEHGVVPMRADLTREDAPGWDKLRAINPSGGIPLTVIYSPSLQQPTQLSSIYTTENLVEAVRSASRK